MKIRNDERKTRETEERLAELAHTAFSDVLTENSQYLSDCRCHILADRWKGMNQDQLAAIRQQQLVQINEHQVSTLTDVHSVRFDHLRYFLLGKYQSRKICR